MAAGAATAGTASATADGSATGVLGGPDAECEAESAEAGAQAASAIPIAKVIGCAAAEAKYVLLPTELGRGSFGIVRLCRGHLCGDVFAMKCVKRTEGCEAEVALLRQIQHPHIVHLIDVLESPHELRIVLERCDTDLREELLSRGPFGGHQLVGLTRQLLHAIAYLASVHIIHRDIKPANVLLKKQTWLGCRFTVKLGDFGWALKAPRATPFAHTPAAVTAFYRPPEILLGARVYSFPVDVWSAGCVLAEMSTAQVLFRRAPIESNRAEFTIIATIFAACGSPTRASCPHLYEMVPNMPTWDCPRGAGGMRWKQILGDGADSIGQDGLDLLGQMLALDPPSRISAQQASEHAYIAI